MSYLQCHFCDFCNKNQQILQKLFFAICTFVRNFEKFSKKFKKIYKNPLTNKIFGVNM